MEADVRLIALLSWYQEPVAWLAETVASIGRAGCSHVVALDGAYELFPNGQARSEGEQADVVRRTAVGAGMGVTVSIPSEPWRGNEVEKRGHLFELGHAVAEPDDWLWVVDGDEVIESVPPRGGLFSVLVGADEDVAVVVVRQPSAIPGEEDVYWPFRKLFRVTTAPIRVIDRHDRYIGPRGEALWVPHDTETWDSSQVVPAVEVLDVVMLHKHNLRPAHRVLQRAKYYTNREEAGIET